MHTGSRKLILWLDLVSLLHCRCTDNNCAFSDVHALHGRTSEKDNKGQDCQGLQYSNRPFSHINWQFRRYLKAVKSSLAHLRCNVYFLPTNYMPKYLLTAYRPVFVLYSSSARSAGFYIRNTIRWHLKWRSTISWKLANLWKELLYCKNFKKEGKTASMLKISKADWWWDQNKAHSSCRAPHSIPVQCIVEPAAGAW